MPRLRSPIRWFGGKGNMAGKLLPLVPQHLIYVEVFGGGASLLFAKEPAKVEVYNDLDSGLVNFFRVLRDPEQFARLYHYASFTPYSREEFYYCRDTWKSEKDPVMRAYKWFVVARMSFSGAFGRSWSFARSLSNRGMADTCSKWLSTLSMLPLLHERVMRVQIEHSPFQKVIPTYDTPDTFFYLDPPYMPETRSGGKYSHEMTKEDHRQLLSIILNCQGKIMISGYPNELYDTVLSEWRRKEWKTVSHATAKMRGTGILGEGAALGKQSRVEVIWMNYSEEVTCGG